MIQRLKKIDTSIGAMAEDGSKIMLLLFLSVAVAICLTYQIMALSEGYPLDYGEAPLVDQAMRLAAGQNIYRADISTPPYTISNYPPLYVVSLVPFLKLFGPSFFAGRTISILSAWASGGFLAIIVYAHTQDRLAGVMTGLLFLAFPFVVYWSSLLRIDFLALALSLAGLCLLARPPIASRRLLAAAILLVAAIYTRQSYALAAPLAAFVWLWAHDWRRALGLAALVGGLGLILFLLLNSLTQGGFYFNIVTANVNEFGMDRLEWNLNRLRDAALALLYIGGASLALIRRWNPSWPLAAPYLAGAALSALTIGKIGSNVNYFLELCAALSLAAGVVVAWSRKRQSSHILRAAIFVTVALQVGPMMRNTLQEYVADWRQRQGMAGELRQLETLVAEAEGPVLADEYMGLLTLQGRPLTMQPFEVTQLARAGIWDQTPLLERIGNKEFSLILIYDRPWHKERWTPEMLQVIGRSYVLTHVLADNRVYQSFKQPIGEGEAACPGAPWRLPSSGVLGVRWNEGGLDFYGRGNEGTVPVYAVAEGLLTRPPEWVDVVAIQHDDPLRQGQKVWSFYAGLGSPSGTDSYIAQDFPVGGAGIPVRAGQVLGYQGTWSGKAFWPTWMHVRFALARATEPGTFPNPPAPENVLDPTPYLGLSITPASQNPNPQPLNCAE